MTNQNSELELLLDVLNTQSEAEAGGVKYIWMDENTIYRFENNRMKKVSASLIKKARKLQQQTATKTKSKRKVADDEEEEELEEQLEEVKPKKKLKQKQQKLVEVEDEDELEDEQPLIMKTKKQSKLSRTKANVDSPIDLNEYWQVKSKLEYQNQELERYKNKVSKLKQYKNIVSRLTGGEYDQPITTNNDYSQQQQQQQQIQSEVPRRNDSLFMFNSI